MSQQETGRMIAGRYQLIKRISAGGMGEVYQAVDTQMFNRVVAVKLLHQRLMGSDHDGSDRLRQRFQEEARVSVLLGDHPNIIKIHDYGLESDYPYLVMEFLGSPPLVGDSLDHLLREQGPIPVARVVRLARQICAGLHYAHSFEGQLAEGSFKGVIHRDIKPSNIFILIDPTLGNQEETVKILDFGIAKIVSDMTLSLGTHGLGFVGSLMYASPEQLRGKRLDPRSDIYSLGIVLYEMLTGRLPLEPETDSVWAWIEAHTHLAPIPIRELSLPYSVPATVEAIVLSCLSKDPRDRPGSMEMLSQYLQNALSDSGQDSSQGSRQTLAQPDVLRQTEPHSTPDPRVLRPPIPPYSPSQEQEPIPTASGQTLADAASTILHRLRQPPRRRSLPLPWIIGSVLLILVPGLVWVFGSFLDGVPQNPVTRMAPWSSDQLLRFKQYNEQRRAAIESGDWQRAIAILDQMIVEYPEQAVELYLYRQQLEQNLNSAEALSLSDPMRRILAVYVKRWENAVLENEWQQADQILTDLVEDFPEMQEIATTYREQLEPVRAAVQFGNWQAALEQLNGVIQQYPEQGGFLRRYREQLRTNLRPSPTPRPLPSFQTNPRSMPTPQSTPTPTPIPQYTPLTVPTLQEAPDLDFVCRLQPTLSMCQDYGVSPEE